MRTTVVTVVLLVSRSWCSARSAGMPAAPEP